MRLNEREKRVIFSYMEACYNMRVARIKMNIGAILLRKYPTEFSLKDKPFFDKYKNKEVIVCSDGENTDFWVILEDNNYIIDKDCFDIAGFVER